MCSPIKISLRVSVVRLTWLFSLRGDTLLNLKNSCSANTLILDEIDQGLDLEGFNIVMRLFRSLENTNIFITSHRENVHEFPFDKVITMVKKNQFSVIEEV